MLIARFTLACVLAGFLWSVAPVAQAGAYEDLFSAIARDDAKEVQTLMLKGVGTNSPDPKLGPAIVYAAQSRSFQSMKVLLESPLTEVDVRNAAGETALMYAALYGRLDAAKLLVAKGAEINQPGWTALHYAASGGSADMVRWLLENDAYIDAGSPNGTTPLMLAARQGQAEIAQLLVQEGADPSLRNEAGLTAADYFARTGETELATWMREKAREFTAKYGTRAKPLPASRR